LVVIARSSDAYQNCSVDKRFRPHRPRSSTVPGSRTAKWPLAGGQPLDADLASIGQDVRDEFGVFS
jgi:hypothetical protein